jgi:hypothetical protein
MIPGAMADGYLTAGSQDGYMYVFGKGKSATTIAAPETTVPLGTAVLIRGTVLDESPAQPGAACVSDESQATYMEYLHMQMPIDGIWHNLTVTGVPVKLLAIDPSNNVIEIGTTTSDVSGTFGYTWTPKEEGLYKITAVFAGSESYGSSWAETSFSVGPAPEPIAFPEQITPPDYTMTIIGGVIAVIIAVAIVGLLIFLALRKR